MKIAGKSVIVSGGASGLGSATAERFVAEGGRVAILDRNAELGRSLADRLGERALFVEADVVDEASTTQAIEHAAAAFGSIDICVNCAGTGGFGRTATEDGPLPLAEFRRLLDINLVGTFNVSRVAAARMIGNAPDPETGERGVIIHTASISSYEGQMGMAAYAASKAGVIGLVLPMTRDLSGYGIRVMAIAAGLFDTPLSASLPKDFLQYLYTLNEFPKRGGQPAEFASLVAHIVGNAYLNGEVIRLDAGTRAPPR